MNHPKYKHDTEMPIAISIGDPAGIGIEVILKALKRVETKKECNPILVGCRKTLNNIYKDFYERGLNELSNPEEYKIIDIPFSGNLEPGQPNQDTGEASFEWLNNATKLVLNGKAKALVTAPIAKHMWHQAGHFYPGQTERLGELASCKNFSMLFTAISPINKWRFNTLLATTHIPLKEVVKVLTPELINNKLDALLKFCKRFSGNPKLAIAGLNPHAGEQGDLGNEEIDWLIPTIKEWKSKHKNIQLDGPFPPDTCWLSAAESWKNLNRKLNNYDGFLALYHDQGLIPVKLIAFESAVNTTIGLPFIRTSPDHGTAFDIAGHGIARPQSMLSAIEAASELAKQMSN